MNNEKEKNAASGGEYERALKSAMNILSFADNTAIRLYKKLRAKGYGEEASREAVEYMITNGYLDEEQLFESQLRILTEKKMYGLVRVKAELTKFGFSKNRIERYDYSSIDFADICYRLLEKKGGVADDKTKAFLMRYGHTYTDIREAQRRTEDGE